MENQVLGIDFGTSFSSVAVLFHKTITVIQDDLGNSNIPSVVYFGEKECIGAGAEHYKKKYPKNTIYEIKRVIGCRYDDPVVERQKSLWPFNIIEAKDHRVQVEFFVNNKPRHYYPEFVVSKILKYLVQLAENKTGEKYTKAIITVPANFNDTQRKCIRIAARFANLDVLRILDEPVAAAVSISIDTNIDNSRVLVYDLGGGTFDFTILEVSVNDYRVIATDGDPNLGGADFTDALTEFARQRVVAETGIDSLNNPRLHTELRVICETMKQELSTSAISEADLDLSRYGGSSYTLIISRVEFETVIRDWIVKTVDIVKTCLETYCVDISTVSGMALVGGSSCIPLIQDEFRRVYPSLTFLKDYDPREVVCRGALVQALSLINDVDQVSIPIKVVPTSIVTDASPITDCETTPDILPSLNQPPMLAVSRPSVPLPPTSLPPPVPSSIAPPPPPVPSSIAPPPPRSIPTPPAILRSIATLPRPYEPLPDEPVHQLAPSGSNSSVKDASNEMNPIAVVPSSNEVTDATSEPLIVKPIEVYPSYPTTSNQPSIPPPPRDLSHITIHPTTPLDLGIRVKGGKMSVIIPRNTSLPYSKSKPYKTNKEHPDCIRCCIYQGNHEMVDGNTKIGIIYAHDLPCHDGIRSEILITFAIDINGVLNVSAHLIGCDIPVQIEMLHSIVLGDQEIETIMEEDKLEEARIINEMKDELLDEIDLRIQLLEEAGDNYTDLIQREQEWLNNYRETASVDEIRACLTRLTV